MGVRLSGGAQITAASSSSSPLAGKAGSVVINAGNIELNDASRIATSALAVDAGAIDITSANGFYLMNGSSVTTSAGIDGGDISMTVGSLIYLLDSEITSEAHGGSGTQGGNISMDPDFVVLDNSPVSANDLLGKGGNILVLSNYMFNPDNSMTATGVSDGVVSTPPPDLDLGRTLVLEKPELVKAENQLRERCAEAINHEFSSLVVVGRGGIEGAPEELQPDFGMEATSAPVGNFAKAKP
jgi:large exoprotein involved in heme utilization and adhesion